MFIYSFSIAMSFDAFLFFHILVVRILVSESNLSVMFCKKFDEEAISVLSND